VLEPLSSSDQTSNNDLAVVPQSTYAQKLVGGATRNSVSNLYVKASSAGALSAAYQEANALLLNTHKISTPASADFSIATQQSILAASTSVNDTLTVMLGGIAVIALLVGGIGVMNIMLVSVTERYREIGVRKAIGARPSLIRRQFLVEASMLGLAGGVLGVLLGVIGAVVIPAVTDSSVILSVPASIGAIAIAIGVGVVFGVYPASRAARLSPIDALRSE
jgi:putative ABC transport system permease protein